MPRARATANPPQRLLRAYAFDPSRGTRLENYLTISIPYEKLARGPVGRKIAVIDYDASNGCYYEGVKLDALEVFAQSGLAPSESNPQFHQQMVYAVVMDTVRRCETALGREVKWRPDSTPVESPYHGLLRVYPHAMQEANAYYDRRLRALLFGYFKAAADAGTNLPGQVVFTCLSHDIIAHETTHAILDGIRPYFGEPTGPDAAAFHEGFADIVALLQHFSFKDSLLDTIQRTGGLIHRRQLQPQVRAEQGTAMIQAEVGEDNPMVDLARQFGEAMGNRQALRTALGTTPDPRLLDQTFEPHARGGILVAAIFDAFFSVYINRTRDLVRIAYPDGREIVPNFLHADLANRLAEEAAKTARRICNICLRALDYCPPVDITFGDYLRALVTSDRDAMAEDTIGYRTALINAFRARGIRPEGVISYSEDALAWDPYEGMRSSEANPDFSKLYKDLNRYEDEPDRENEQQLYQRLWGKADSFRSALGLSLIYPVQAKSLNTLQRVRPDGSVQRQIVAELVQKQEGVQVQPGDSSSMTFKFRGGTTLLINRQGEVKLSISKPIEGPAGEARLARQRAFIQQRA
ncbi:MAG TPA: hypothetical protein VN999_14160, partial [Thermoanaerobaculia bacterium]|nr:hypothetical protein [Thermoanaerobaculia bacterium]